MNELRQTGQAMVEANLTGLQSATNWIGASDAEGANVASNAALPSANPMDEQLVREFIGNSLVTREHRAFDSIGISFIPWSQIDAVLRRLGVVF